MSRFTFRMSKLTKKLRISQGNDELKKKWHGMRSSRTTMSIDTHSMRHEARTPLVGPLCLTVVCLRCWAESDWVLWGKLKALTHEHLRNENMARSAALAQQGHAQPLRDDVLRDIHEHAAPKHCNLVIRRHLAESLGPRIQVRPAACLDARYVGRSTCT